MGGHMTERAIMTNYQSNPAYPGNNGTPTQAPIQAPMQPPPQAPMRPPATPQPRQQQPIAAPTMPMAAPATPVAPIARTTGAPLSPAMNSPIQNSQAQNAKPSGVTSVGGWILTMILSVIPIVGQILLILWCCGFSKVKHSDRRNWALAQLIIEIVGIVIGVIIFIITVSAASSSSRYY